MPESWAAAALRKIEGMQVPVVFLIIPYVCSERAHARVIVLFFLSHRYVLALDTSQQTQRKMLQEASRK